MLWSQYVHLAAEGRERFLSYMLHGDCVPRALAASAHLLFADGFQTLYKKRE